MTSVRNDLGIFVQSTLINFERGCNPTRSSSLQFLRRNTQLDHVFDSVNSNDIAILDERDGTTYLGLGDNMTDTKSVRSIGDFLISVVYVEI